MCVCVSLVVQLIMVTLTVHLSVSFPDPGRCPEEAVIHMRYESPRCYRHRQFAALAAAPSGRSCRACLGPYHQCLAAALPSRAARGRWQNVPMLRVRSESSSRGGRQAFRRPTAARALVHPRRWRSGASSSARNVRRSRRRVTWYHMSTTLWRHRRELGFMPQHPHRLHAGIGA